MCECLDCCLFQVMEVPLGDSLRKQKVPGSCSDCVIADVLPVEILNALPGLPEVVQSTSMESMDSVFSFEKDWSYQGSSTITSPTNLSPGSFLSQLINQDNILNSPQMEESNSAAKTRRSLYTSTSYPPVSVYH